MILEAIDSGGRGASGSDRLGRGNFRLCPRRPLRIPRRRPAHDHRLPLPQAPQTLPPMKYNVKKSLRVPLDANERKIEAALPATPTRANPTSRTGGEKRLFSALQGLRTRINTGGSLQKGL